MINGLCHSGSWGFLQNLGGWSGAGLILSMIFWVGLIFVLALLVVWAVRRARVRAATFPNPTRQPTSGSRATPTQVQQAQYAQGEITSEQK